MWGWRQKPLDATETGTVLVCPGRCSTGEVSSDPTSAAALLSLPPNFSPFRNKLPSPRRGRTEGQKALRAAACIARDPQGMGSWCQS